MDKISGLGLLLRAGVPLLIGGNVVRSYMKSREEADPGYKAAMDTERLASKENKNLRNAPMPGIAYGPQDFASLLRKGYTG